jgi:hypothetical protein
MQPGPYYVYRCPGCKNLLVHGSYFTGNTFNAKIFSDGKMIAPMQPDFPDLTKCNKCSRIIWLSKSRVIGVYDFGTVVNPIWKDADTVEFLDVNDICKAISMEMYDNRDEEIYIRRLLW